MIVLSIDDIEPQEGKPTMGKNVVLPMRDGSRILVTIDASKVYGVYEKSERKWSFGGSFPFIRRVVDKYVRFRVKDTYSSSFEVGMGLPSFCEMLGIDYCTTEECSIRAAAKYGES